MGDSKFVLPDLVYGPLGLFVDGIVSVSKALFVFPHGRIYEICCHKPWSSVILGLTQYVSNAFFTFHQ